MIALEAMYMYMNVFEYMYQGVSNSQYAQLYHPPSYFVIVGFSFLLFCFLINESVKNVQVYGSNRKLIVKEKETCIIQLSF